MVIPRAISFNYKAIGKIVKIIKVAKAVVKFEYMSVTINSYSFQNSVGSLNVSFSSSVSISDIFSVMNQMVMTS